MKKLLSTIMALVMLLSLVPMAVAEEGEVTGSDTKTETTVAEIGGLYYDTLADAVAAVRVHGNTVTLVGDVTLSETVVVDKDLTVDMNGHNITANNVRALHQKQGTLNITGKGTIASNKTQDGTFDADKSVIRVGDDNATGAAVFTLGEGVTVTSNHCYGVTYFGMKDETLTINGTVAVTGNATALSGNGASKYKDVNVSVTVNGTVTAEKANAIYKPEKGTLTINGVVKGAGGIEVKSGTVTIGANAEVTAVAATTSHSVNSNGCSTSGYALVAVANKNYQDNVNITVSGGKVIGQVAKVTDHTDAPEGKLAISGGAFTDLANAVKYATDGAKITLAGDATGDVVIPADKTITIDLGGHKLTNVSGNTITNEGTLTITGTGTVDNVTNGRAALYNKGMATLNGGNFTRSKENADNNKDNGGGNSYYTILNDKGATMTINEGVTVSNVGHFSSMIRNGGDEKTTAVSTMTINGGTFSGGINTVKNDENGVLTIKGGDFSNTSQFVIMNWNKATISDGTFEANASAEAVLFTSKYNDRAVGELKIEGGMYVCAANQKLIVDRYDNDDQYLGTAVISGGKFSSNPSAFVADKSLEVSKDTAGQYTVSKKTNAAETSEVKLPAATTEGTTTATIGKGDIDTGKDLTVSSDVASVTINQKGVEAIGGNADLTLTVKTIDKPDDTNKAAYDEAIKGNDADSAVVVDIKLSAGSGNAFTQAVEGAYALVTVKYDATGKADKLKVFYLNGSVKQELTKVADAANGAVSTFSYDDTNKEITMKLPHFSQYLITTTATTSGGNTSGGSSVIKTGAGSSAASGTHTVTTDLTPGSITKVTVDGKVVDAKYYTVNGSNVTFTAEFLKTLKNGSHTVTVENATKIAKGVFTVNNPTNAQSPTTADAGVALYAGMAIASVMGTGVVFTSRKRKNH